MFRNAHEHAKLVISIVLPDGPSRQFQSQKVLAALKSPPIENMKLTDHHIMTCNSMNWSILKRIIRIWSYESVSVSYHRVMIGPGQVLLPAHITIY